MSNLDVSPSLTSSTVDSSPVEGTVQEICSLDWATLTSENLINVAWAYYYFSIQFRENLEIARNLFPDDKQLQELDHGERNTDNLSPWPGVAHAGERMNHDEFMRRALTLQSISDDRRQRLAKIGEAYLTSIRSTDITVRALALASYEDGGLENVFRSILTAPNWEGHLLQAFKHFLVEHIKFDSDPDHGHGSLCRHLAPDPQVPLLWVEFKNMLVEAAPQLRRA
jgi:hypothetical protein